jgi:hypothetical protein
MVTKKKSVPVIFEPPCTYRYLINVFRRALRKSGYNTYRGWTQIDYQNHYNVNQKDEGT